MGDAVLSRCASRPARLSGYHREFAHESRRRWGSPEKPCPILGLREGGECWGVAYAVSDADEARVARNLAQREAAAERRRETRTVETPEGDVPAWVFVSTAGATAQDTAAVEARLREAHGIVGTGAEYVRSLVHALDLHGLRDPLVDDYWARLRG